MIVIETNTHQKQMRINNVRLIYNNGLSFVMEKCPGEHDIDKRRSWIQSQITQNTQSKTTMTNNEVVQLIKFSIFWLNYKMYHIKYNHINDETYKKWDINDF